MSTIDYLLAIRKELHNTFSGELLDNIATGHIYIPEHILLNGIATFSEVGPYTKDLRGDHSGLTVELEKKYIGARIKATVKVRVLKLVIDENEQVMVLKVVDEKVAGRGIYGKILMAIASVIMGKLTPFEQANKKLYEIADFDSSNRKVTLRLGELNAIQRVLKPAIPGNASSVPLKHIRIRGCEHVEGGIQAKIFPSSEISSVLETGRGLLNKIRRTLPLGDLRL